MIKKFFFINLILSGLAIFLVYELYAIWSVPIEEVSAPQKANTGKAATETDKTVKDIGTYQIIVQKDLFRPSRTEAARSDLPATPPPKLFGTVIMDNDKIALLEDPTTKKRRSYHIKDSIGNYVISEILNNKVILLRGEEKIEVSLREIKTVSHPTKPRAILPGPASRPAMRPIPTPLPSSPQRTPAVQSKPQPVIPAQPIPQSTPAAPAPVPAQEFPEAAPLPESNTQ